MDQRNRPRQGRLAVLSRRVSKSGDFRRMLVGAVNVAFFFVVHVLPHISHLPEWGTEHGTANASLGRGCSGFHDLHLRL